MDTATRITVYERQNGPGRPLTNRQSRRIRRKRGRELVRMRASLAASAAETLEILDDPATVVAIEEGMRDYGPVPHPDHVLNPQACPTCGAVGDEVCRTASGRPARSPHKGRGVAA